MPARRARPHGSKTATGWSTARRCSSPTPAPTSPWGVVITAVTGEGEISNLVVENGTPRLRRSPTPMQKLGWRASDTRELAFQAVRVPEENLLGPRGEGFQQFLQILDGGRISVAAMGVGLAQGCLRPRVCLRARAAAVRPADRDSSRRCRTSSSTWRPRSKRPACSSTARPGRRIRDGRSRAPRRWRSCTRVSCRIGPRTGRCRSTAATASWTSTRSRASTATRRSWRSARARTRCSVWSSRRQLGL